MRIEHSIEGIDMLRSHEMCDREFFNRDAMRSVGKCCQFVPSFQKTGIGGALQPETSSCELPPHSFTNGRMSQEAQSNEASVTSKKPIVADWHRSREGHQGQDSGATERWWLGEPIEDARLHCPPITVPKGPVQGC